jgi:hypothetical protein
VSSVTKYIKILKKYASIAIRMCNSMQQLNIPTYIPVDTEKSKPQTDLMSKLSPVFALENKENIYGDIFICKMVSGQKHVY